MSRRSPSSLTTLGKYLALALTLPASVLGGYLFGAVADDFFHTPLLRVVGVLLGIVAGLIQILRELSRDDRRAGPRA